MSERLTARSLLRLDPTALGGLPRVGGAQACPDCGPRSATAAGIVHLGVGAFMRAHLGTYAEDLVRIGWPGHIHAVSLHSDRAEGQLGPQDCLYSLTIRDRDGDIEPRVISAISRVSTGPEAAIDAIASPDTALVTLTVTEKAYRTGWDEHGPSVPDVIVQGLAMRDRAAAPPVIASLDNVLRNGDRLRDLVLRCAAELDPELEEWIEIEVEFPNSVVDRMVPATIAADLDSIEAALGLRDEAAVVSERYRSWVIESVEGLPPLGEVGVELTHNIMTFERRKLWLLNGPHSALAYAGLVHGCTTIAQAAGHPVVSAFASRISRAATAVIIMAAGGGPDRGAPATTTEDYAAQVLQRFANPALGHRCVQVGADGSQKLPQRVFPVVDGLLIAGLGVTDHALLVACWLAAVSGMEVGGTQLPAVDDPLAEGLRSALLRQGTRGLVDAAMDRAWRERMPGFVDAVLTELDALAEGGAAAFSDRQ